MALGRQEEIMIIGKPKQSGTDYCSVRFRKPGHKGETWYVTVSGRGGGPYLGHEPYFDPSIPATFKADVTQHVTGRYHVYTMAEFTKKAKITRENKHPKAVYAALWKQAVAFCTKNGYVNVDPRWKK
jgi:hypothetical protein